jgi:heme-degrading monooxygenase HmoA
MHARVTTLQTPADTIDEGVERFREALSNFKGMDGNVGALLLVDRGSGKALGVTLWQDEAASAASREQAKQVREQAAQDAHGEVKGVEEFEVAVWDVRA